MVAHLDRDQNLPPDENSPDISEESPNSDPDISNPTDQTSADEYDLEDESLSTSPDSGANAKEDQSEEESDSPLIIYPGHDDWAEQIAQQELLERQAAQQKVEEYEFKIRILKKRYGLEESEEAPDEPLVELSPLQRQALKASLRSLESRMKHFVKGQDEAVEAVVQALKSWAVGMHDPRGPLASFLALGRTGVGKTFLAQILAQELSGEHSGVEFNFIRIDASEFSHGHEGTRLTGSPPSYIGSDKPGELEQIKHHPFNVILVDEIEKGSEELHDLLLQILDEGRVTVSAGSKGDSNTTEISLQNCIIMLTSNVGVADIDKATESRVGFSTTHHESGLSGSDIREITRQALKKMFKPEFLNRIDETLAFNDLSREAVEAIAQNEIQAVIKQAEQEHNCTVVVSDTVRDLVIRSGYSIEFGARELRRVVKRLVRYTLTNLLFDHSDHELDGSLIRLDTAGHSVQAKLIPQRSTDERKSAA